MLLTHSSSFAIVQKSQDTAVWQCQRCSLTSHGVAQRCPAERCPSALSRLPLASAMYAENIFMGTFRQTNTDGCNCPPPSPSLVGNRHQY